MRSPFEVWLARGLPVAAAPVPAPMAATPAPMAVVAMPVHLLRLQLRRFIAAGDGGMGVGIVLRPATGNADGLRRQRRGLRGGGQCCGARRNTDGKFQKIPALHDVSSDLAGK